MAKLIIHKRENGKLRRREIEVEIPQSMVVQVSTDEHPEVGDVGELKVCQSRYGTIQVKVDEKIDDKTYKLVYDHGIV
jgi:hypothetical protein